MGMKAGDCSRLDDLRHLARRMEDIEMPPAMADEVHHAASRCVVTTAHMDRLFDKAASILTAAREIIGSLRRLATRWSGVERPRLYSPNCCNACSTRRRC